MRTMPCRADCSAQFTREKIFGVHNIFLHNLMLASWTQFKHVDAPAFTLFWNQGRGVFTPILEQEPFWSCMLVCAKPFIVP